VFYFSVGQPRRCIAGNPLASTRPQKFTTSACMIKCTSPVRYTLDIFIVLSRRLFDLIPCMRKM